MRYRPMHYQHPMKDRTSCGVLKTEKVKSTENMDYVNCKRCEAGWNAHVKQSNGDKSHRYFKRRSKYD